MPSSEQFSDREGATFSHSETEAGAAVKESPVREQVESTPLRTGNRRRASRSSVSAGASPPLSPPARPTPLPKRPKGRLFVGFLLFVVCAVIVHSVWDWQFRYEAHGVVQGRVFHVSPPWNGNLKTLHVREGDVVRQDQLLATFSNIELEQELAKVADELKLAQAELEAQVSQLKWQSQVRGDRNQKALGEYYEMWGELLDQRSRLSQAATDLQRLEATQKKNGLAVRQRDLDHARFRVAGLGAKVEKLTDAVGELKKRVDIYEQFQDDASAQLRPKLLRIDNLQAELKRLREQIQQGQVCSPANGTVIKVLQYAGEYSIATQHVMEVVEDSSLEPVLYLPQGRAVSLSVGDEIQVKVTPGPQTLITRVARLGDQMEFAPPNIARYYGKNERLLPVFLKLQRRGGDPSRLYLGSEVRLPHRWTRVIDGSRPDSDMEQSMGQARPGRPRHVVKTNITNNPTVDLNNTQDSISVGGYHR